VLGAVLQVVEAEAPVHAADLTGRVAAMWDTRAGSRIAARILEACAAAERAGRLRRRGEFFWGASDAAPVRARGGTGIPAERVAPEEYEAAVRLVLAGGHGLARPQLTNEVRAVLGYGRAGPALEEAIGAAVDRLLASGALGEGSSGIRLR
jgi:hypothetical protein